MSGESMEPMDEVPLKRLGTAFVRNAMLLQRALKNWHKQTLSYKIDDPISHLSTANNHIYAFYS